MSNNNIIDFVDEMISQERKSKYILDEKTPAITVLSISTNNQETTVFAKFIPQLINLDTSIDLSKCRIYLESMLNIPEQTTVITLKIMLSHFLKVMNVSLSDFDKVLKAVKIDSTETDRKNAESIPVRLVCITKEKILIEYPDVIEQIEYIEDINCYELTINLNNLEEKITSMFFIRLP